MRRYCLKLQPAGNGSAEKGIPEKHERHYANIEAQIQIRDDWFPHFFLTHLTKQQDLWKISPHNIKGSGIFSCFKRTCLKQKFEEHGSVLVYSPYLLWLVALRDLILQRENPLAVRSLLSSQQPRSSVRLTNPTKVGQPYVFMRMYVPVLKSAALYFFALYFRAVFFWIIQLSAMSKPTTRRYALHVRFHCQPVLVTTHCQRMIE